MYLFFIKEFGRNYITVYSVHYLYHSVFCDSVGFKNIVVQLLSHVWLFVTPWTAACQASLSLTISQILPKFMSIESVMLSNCFILCYPLLLLPSIFPSMRVFSNDSAVHIRWPKYWSFSFSLSPSKEYTGLFPFGLTGLISLQSKGLSKNLLHPGSDEGLAAFFNICRRVLSLLETQWLQWVT